MKLITLTKKFTNGFKQGWQECQSDGDMTQQTEEHGDMIVECNQHEFSTFEDVSPNDTNHPYHNYYYGKK